MTDHVAEDGAIAQRSLGDGRELVLYKMIFTYRLCIGGEDGYGYDDAWCYHNLASALRALKDWDGEGDDPPYGWHRHIGSGRRRPDGDPAKEYVDH